MKITEDMGEAKLMLKKKGTHKEGKKEDMQKSEKRKSVLTENGSGQRLLNKRH